MKLSLLLPLSLFGVAFALPPTDRSLSFTNLEARGYPARCPDGQTAKSKGVTPDLNGCSGVPDGKFKGCCNQHDICYSTCSRTKRDCDDTFYTCMKEVCSTNYNKWYEAPVKAACYAGAATYHTGVAVGGDSAFKKRTEKHCTCS